MSGYAVSRGITDHKRRLAVAPASSGNAHVAYAGDAPKLAKILSVEGIRALPKNLSCQCGCKLLLVRTKGTGLGCGVPSSRSTSTLTAAGKHKTGYFYLALTLLRKMAILAVNASIV